MKRSAIIFVALSFFATASLGQGRRGMGGMRGGGAGRIAPAMDEHTTLMILTALLTLTDAQQQQLGAVFDAAMKVAEPLNTQIENGKQAIFGAVKSGKSDDQIKALVDQQDKSTGQLLALQAQTFSKMCAMLTTAQKAQVDDTMFTDIGDFLASARAPLPDVSNPAAMPGTPTAAPSAPPAATPGVTPK
jgi:Spy/CpxP family protein refolding chaperone